MNSFNRLQRRHIGEILVDQGLVTKEHVDEALRIQASTDETPGAILVDMGCITDMDITKTIVMQYQLPFIDLQNYQVNEKLVDMFEAKYLHKHKIMPFDQVGSMLLCAVAEVPLDEVLSEIPRTTQRNVALYVAALDDVRAHLERLAPLPEEACSEHSSSGGRAARTAQAAKSRSTAAGAGAPRSVGMPFIFEEESSEAVLEALDSTWDSIFESIDDSSDDHTNGGALEGLEGLE